jgi:hypothetical protein
MLIRAIETGGGRRDKEEMELTKTFCKRFLKKSKNKNI